MSYTYKANDLVETTTDARGKTATYTYNTRNLPTGVSYNDSGATPSVSFGYDEFGMRNQMTDGEGSTTYSYGDIMHRLTSEQRTFTGLSGYYYKHNYSYNYGDMPTRVNYVSDAGLNKNVNYVYTRGAALAGVGTNFIGTDANTTSNVLTSLTYRGFGGIKTLLYGTNPYKLTLGYNDQRQQMTSMVVALPGGSSQIIGQSYDYNNGGNNNGRIQKITDGMDAAYTTTYGYDDYNRLTSATATAYTRGYTYDEWGNLKTVTASGAGQSGYTINYATSASGAPSTNRILNVNGTLSYSYDNAGNLTQESSTTYSDDAASRFKEVGTGGNNI